MKTFIMSSQICWNLFLWLTLKVMKFIKMLIFFSQKLMCWHLSLSLWNWNNWWTKRDNLRQLADHVSSGCGDDVHSIPKTFNHTLGPLGDSGGTEPAPPEHWGQTCYYWQCGSNKPSFNTLEPIITTDFMCKWLLLNERLSFFNCGWVLLSS